MKKFSVILLIISLIILAFVKIPKKIEDKIFVSQENLNYLKELKIQS